jgi:hypothetical protein
MIQVTARIDGCVKRLGAAIGAAILLAIALLPFAAHSGTRIPYNGEFHAQLDEIFFESDHAREGRAVPAKVDAYRAFVGKKLHFLEGHVTNREVIDRGRSADSAKKRFRNLDTTIALEHILDLLGRMSETTDLAESHDLAAEILMLEYATRSYADPIGSIKIPIHLKNIVFEWRAPNRTTTRGARREASNLVNPATNEFYTHDELEAMIRGGFDISTLDPPDESPFWRAKPDISAVDIVENYFGGGDPIHQGDRSEFPPFRGAEFEFDELHLTQSKPKIDAFYSDADCAALPKKKKAKCRRKVKLKFGMETHADPQANALLSALGFNVDVSAHLKDIRIHLGNESIRNVERDWIGYFDRQRAHTYIPLESVLKETQLGPDGGERDATIVFHETVAELKPPEADRIGYFSFSWGMAQQMREARALFLFNAWIANSDMKDEENNKVILRRDQSGEYQMYLVQQDLGHSFGLILPERPNAFPWDLVETDFVAKAFGWVRGSIELNYIDLQNNGLLENATYADLKWMARRIAQLTRAQIEAAMGLGHWPGGIGQLYAEKLINRRNQLVSAFGLETEYPLLPVDRHLTTQDGSVVGGQLVRNRWDDSPINFDRHWEDALGPIGQFLADRAKKGIQFGVGAIDLIDPGDIDIALGVSVLPRVLVRMSRDVQFNPEPEGAFDQYITVDTMELGLRVGVGYIGSVEGTWVRKIQLAYPMATQSEAIGSGMAVLNLQLPFDVRRGKLPEKYVLFREDSYKYGARLSSDSTSFLGPLGMGAHQNWVKSQRSVIDHRGADPIIWTDSPEEIERDANLFLQLALLQVPFFGVGNREGSLEGQALVLDGSRLDELADDGVAIFDHVVRRADFSDAGKISVGRPTRATSDYASSRSSLNLVFLSWRSRSLDEHITLRDELGVPHTEERQSEIRRAFSWSFLDNGETQELTVRGVLDVASPEQGPTVAVTLSVDDLNTHSDELDSYYTLLNGLSGQSYLPTDFEATDWEVSGEPSGRWTRLLTKGVIQLRGRAIERLIEIDADAYWLRLAEKLHAEPRNFTRRRKLAAYGTSKELRARQRSLRGRSHPLLIRRALGALDTFQRASRADSEHERLRLVVLGLYRANFRSGDTFDPILLSTLLEEIDAAELIEEEELFVQGRIYKAFEDQSNLPERVDIVGRLGKEQSFPGTQYRFSPFDGVELYKMLDWVRENRVEAGARTKESDPVR